MTDFSPQWAPDPRCRSDVNPDCARLAAEYISSPATVAGLIAEGVFYPATSYQRTCTECADVTPGLISRRPLTAAVAA